MSQAKVDRYKEQKKNREKIMQKEKREKILLNLSGLVILVALVGWIAYSGYDTYTKGKTVEAKTYTVDTAAIDDLMEQLATEETE